MTAIHGEKVDTLMVETRIEPNAEVDARTVHGVRLSTAKVENV
jgi:hypothetical protein